MDARSATIGLLSSLSIYIRRKAKPDAFSIIVSDLLLVQHFYFAYDQHVQPFALPKSLRPAVDVGQPDSDRSKKNTTFWRAL